MEFNHIAENLPHTFQNDHPSSSNLLDGLPVGIFRCDREGAVTYVNEQACRLMQMAADKLLGVGWVQGVHPRDREQIYLDWQSSIKQGIPFHCEGRLLDSDGSSTWVETRTMVEQDAAGNFAGYIGTLVDISDRKGVEVALQGLVESTASATGAAFFSVLVKQIAQALGIRHASISYIKEDQLHTLAYWSDGQLLTNTSYSLSNTPCGQTLVEGSFYCAEGLQQMFPCHPELMQLQAESYLGVTIQDAMGMPKGVLAILDSKPIQNRKRFQHILHIFAARASAELEQQQATIALQQLNVELEHRVKERTTELTNANNNLIIEISERRRTEAALSLQLERLNRLYYLVLTINHAETIKDIYDITLQGIQQTFKISGAAALAPDERGVLRYCASCGISQSYKEAVESYLEANRQIGLQGIVISDVKEQQGEAFLDALRKVEGICASASFPLQYQDQHLGKIIIYYNTPHQFTAEEIQLAETIATYVATAITRKQSEKALQQTNEQLAVTNAELARATRLKDEFLANMSHELRTPLNAILGLSEGLIDEAFGSLNHQQKKSVATIERSGKHLLDLINDILDLAKIEAGKAEIKLSLISANSLCSTSLSFVKQLALQKQIQLKTEISQETITIEADERRLCQALINLLSNAIKFTNEGGTVTLEVMPDRSQSQVKFSVIDTGIGIAQEDISKLFQSFVQIDSRLNRQYDGTGLGLVLARRIVELHRGTITVESKVGQGSRFTISLPWKSSFTTPESSQIQCLNSAQAIAVSDVSSLTMQPLILLAEDNEVNTQMVGDYLSYRGYRIIKAKNGFAAIEEAKLHQPDLILMDIQMPIMDGLTAIQHIRQDSTIAEIPIIALTALAMSGDEQRCLDAGATAYVAKPMKLKHLIMLIQQLLQEK